MRRTRVPARFAPQGQQSRRLERLDGLAARDPLVAAALDGREVYVLEVCRQLVHRGGRQIDPGRAGVPRHESTPGAPFVRRGDTRRHVLRS